MMIRTIFYQTRAKNKGYLWDVFQAWFQDNRVHNHTFFSHGRKRAGGNPREKNGS